MSLRDSIAEALSARRPNENAGDVVDQVLQALADTDDWAGLDAELALDAVRHYADTGPLDHADLLAEALADHASLATFQVPLHVTTALLVPDAHHFGDGSDGADLDDLSSTGDHAIDRAEESDLDREDAGHDPSTPTPTAEEPEIDDVDTGDFDPADEPFSFDALSSTADHLFDHVAEQPHSFADLDLDDLDLDDLDL